MKHKRETGERETMRSNVIVCTELIEREVKECLFVCLLTVLVCRNCFDDETKRIDRYRSSEIGHHQKSNSSSSSSSSSSNGGGGNGISSSGSSSIKEEEELPWLKEKLRFICRNYCDDETKQTD